MAQVHTNYNILYTSILLASGVKGPSMAPDTKMNIAACIWPQAKIIAVPMAWSTGYVSSTLNSSPIV